jgi:para-nitrobenzyl esterase
MSLLHLLVLTASIIFSVQAVITQTRNGDILGVSSNLTDSYLGIRYGNIPARWLPAILTKSWNDTLNATAFGAICYQYGPFQQPKPMVESEDCLFLNIWVPKTNNSSLPVRVWFHGGGYTAGFSDDYDGENLAHLSQSIIVTINYRLGLFGFFPLANLTPYNLGWIDQQLALQWVQENIPSFGGDPTNVMLFGQSAGGGSVIVHLIMESSWPLYSSAVLESAGPFRLANCKENEQINIQLLEKAFPECQSSLTCFQQLNASRFYQVLTMNWITLWPCIGEQSQLPEQPITLIRQGFYNKQAKILGGFNSNEGQSTTFIFNQNNVSMSSTRYRDLAEQYQVPLELINRYDPTTTDKNYFNAFTWLIGDYLCNCPTFYFFNHLSSSSIYVYFFIHPSENWAFTPLNFNATHLTEIAYVFHSNFGFTQFTPAEANLSLKIIDYFTSFHRSEQPWPSYKINQSIIILDIGDDPMKIQFNFDRQLIERCSFVLKYLDADDCHAYLTEQECLNITHCQWIDNHCDEMSTSSAAYYRLSFATFFSVIMFLLFVRK